MEDFDRYVVMMIDLFYLLLFIGLNEFSSQVPNGTVASSRKYSNDCFFRKKIKPLTFWNQNYSVLKTIRFSQAEYPRNSSQGTGQNSCIIVLVIDKRHYQTITDLFPEHAWPIPSDAWLLLLRWMSFYGTFFSHYFEQLSSNDRKHLISK